MSFDQRSFDDKTGVNADSFSAQSSMQHMSRRCIMSLSVKAASIVGLASGGLFCTASAYGGGVAPSLRQRYSYQGILLSTSIIPSATLLASSLERPYGLPDKIVPDLYIS